MSFGQTATLVLLSTLLTTSRVLAQTTRTEQIDQDKEAKAASVKAETREKGDVLLTKVEHLFVSTPPGIRPSLGDFRPGAGLAAGVAYATPVVGRALSTTSIARSVRNFKLLKSTLDLPPLAADRVRITAFVGWDDAPTLGFFGVGSATSLDDRVTYGLTSTEFGGNVAARAARWFRYEGGIGYLNIRSSDGGGPPLSASRFSTDPNVAGIGSTPAWLHTSVAAGFDSRGSAGYTDHGGLYRLAFHEYADPGGQFSFHRTEADLRQFIPVLHDNWIVALQARTNITGSAQDQVIPYFMLPSLGGRDSLRGFADYRFASNDSLLLRSELRWTPSSVIDMAVFMDRGAVGSRLSDLNLHDLKRDWGIGARFHGDAVTALRIDIARSVEGWRYTISRSASF